VRSTRGPHPPTQSNGVLVSRRPGDAPQQSSAQLIPSPIQIPITQKKDSPHKKPAADCRAEPGLRLSATLSASANSAFQSFCRKNLRRVFPLRAVCCVAARLKITLAIAPQKAIIISHQEHEDHKETSTFPLPSCLLVFLVVPKKHSEFRNPTSDFNCLSKILNSTYFVPQQFQKLLRFKSQSQTPRDKTTEFCPKRWDPGEWDKTPFGGE